MLLRQLPQLYLRGSICNETMRNLDQSERDNIDRLTQEISKSPLLAGHKFSFTEKLGHTIGGDYYTDRAAASQEFDIAIWRAIVYLLHHSDYKYRCGCCDETQYLTHKNRPKVFDRRFPICPACNNVLITDAGDSQLTVGQHVNIDDLQKLILAMPYNSKKPKHESPILPIKGTKKIDDHEKILTDPDQIVKYFGGFCSNYLRQTLRENEIKFHSKDPYQVSGPADTVAVDEIHSLLTQLKVPHTYIAKANPSNGSYHIQVELCTTNQSVSRALRVLIDKYAELGVTISANEIEVSVGVVNGAPIAEAVIITPQPVCMQGKGPDDDDDSTSVCDAYQHRIRADWLGGPSMQEDGIALIESEDLIKTIRESLNDKAQQVYDIIIGQGETYDKFVEFHGKRVEKMTPCNSHIAQFLGTNSRQVTAWVNDIRMQCLAHNINDA